MTSQLDQPADNPFSDMYNQIRAEIRKNSGILHTISLEAPYSNIDNAMRIEGEQFDQQNQI